MAISPIFDQPSAGFVLLDAGEKYPPIEEGWQKPENAHSFQEADSHAARGGNVGALAGIGPYIGLDKDDPNAFDDLTLPASTLWETRPGRLGMRFVCHDRTPELLAKYGKTANQSQIYLFDSRRIINGKYPAVGELKLERSYQTIPPSWKTLEDGTRADYKMISEVPPAEISLEWLLSELLWIGIVFSETPKASKLEANVQKLETIKKDAANKQIDKVAKAKQFFNQALQDGTAPHNRNKTGFWLACQLRDLGLEAGEASEYMRSYAHGVPAGDHPYTEEDAQKSLEQAYNHEPRAPPKSESRRQEEDLLKTLPDRIEADPRTIKDPAVIRVLAVTRTNDPIEYDLTIDAIKKANRGLKVDTINKVVDEWIQKNSQTTEKHIETPRDIKEKALAIATKGDPLKFLIWQAQRNHLGDIDYQKVLIASIASAASNTSNGIQPGGNGEKGSGKSDACAATYHLIPMDRRLDGSLSPMSLFYLQQKGMLKPGMILFSDDVEYGPITPIFKRSTARFQQGITHFTVSGGKTREAMELKIPPRMVWWLTSVESVDNEQAFDRQHPISTDSSIGHKQRVTKEIAARRARKELRLAEDEGIHVSRAIIADIFDNGLFKVLIPQAEKAEWLKVSDFRGQEQFWDLVDALCILRWRQRRKDENGWLIAEDQDLIEAKAIHSAHKVAHFADLTEAEVKVIGVMTSGQQYTQKQLTEALDIAQCTLSQRLKSIMAKTPIITEDYEQGKKLYSLNPNKQLGADYWNHIEMIKLKIDKMETYCSQTNALLQCYCNLIGIPIGMIINNSNRIPSSLLQLKEESIEDICNHLRSCGNCPWVRGDISSILILPKNTNNDQKEQQETLLYSNKSDNNGAIDTNNVIGKAVGTQIRQSGDAVGKPTMGKISRPTPARKVPKAQRSPEMEKFKNILLGLKGPFTFDQLCIQCDTACLPPLKYKAWIQEEEQCGRMVHNNGHYEVIREAEA